MIRVGLPKRSLAALFLFIVENNMEEILKLQSITKNYAGVRALSNVSISFRRGHIHSIVGENGAGKSTLIQIITGAVSPSVGELFFENRRIEHMTPIKSKKLGIAAVYQELNLIEELTVYQNIFYGKEFKKGWRLDENAMRNKAVEILDSLNVSIPVDQKIRSLGIGSRQIVEIAKALTENPNVILFDEPTASLSPQEAKHLHHIIRSLAHRNIAVIFVSHKLDEVLQISDTISILRDGHLVSSKTKKDSWKDIYDIPSLVEQMLGKKLAVSKQTFALASSDILPALEVEGLCNDKISNIGFRLYPGEILSLSGMLGSMRTEVLSAIFAVDKLHSGTIKIHGQKKSIRSPQEAIGAGIGYITEDRKDSGLFMELSIRENMSIACLSQFQRMFSIDKASEERRIITLLDELNVKYSSLDQKVKELSGGNQQKIALGKWLMASLDIILLDEPTRGVDVGAKEEIYKIIQRLSEEGKSILMVSSEIEEVIRLSHRTLVLNHGKIVSEYRQAEMSADRILQDSSKFISEG